MLRRLALVAIVGVATLAGAGIGQAQPGEDPDPVEVEPPNLVSAVATCDAGSASVTVYVDSNDDPPLRVRLDRVRPDTASQTKGTVLDEEHLVHRVTFESVAVGDYEVHVDAEGFTGPADGIPVTVKPCGVRPSDPMLDVEVECRAGWGIANFRIANPTTGEVRDLTLLVDDFEAWANIEISPGLFLRITENRYTDGEHTAQLVGPGVDITKVFTVTCEAGNAPRLEAAAACEGSKGRVTVGLLNPNRAAVDYTLSVKGQTRTVSVGGGERASVVFADVPDGDHPVLVTGSDRTEAATVVAVRCVPVTSTTTTTTTTSTGTTTSTATTTTPAPQGRSGGGLASTGASVGGLVGLGALVLAAGGALLVIARRRRAPQE